MFGQAQSRHLVRLVVWTLKLLATALMLYWMWYGLQNRERIEILEKQVAAQFRDRVVFAKQVQAQLDGFYRTLYTDPDLKPQVIAVIQEPRRPSVVEVWQLNRDKELRTRIERMERWRVEIERQLRELR